MGGRFAVYAMTGIIKKLQGLSTTQEKQNFKVSINLMNLEKLNV